MGYYLNGTQAFSIYESETKKPYFVDKTLLLRELFPLVLAGNNHICITRPRRFGKSVMAAMVASFFGKGIDSGCIFDSLKISAPPSDPNGNSGAAEQADIPVPGQPASTQTGKDSFELQDSKSNLDSPEPKKKYNYRDFMNRYNVIYINFLEAANLSKSYEEFIRRIEMFLSRDLRKQFPDVDYWKGLSPIEHLRMIHEDTQENFILVFDEWDCIFHKTYTTGDDRRSFINWLSAMTKDKGYVTLSYMTGVLPIAKYSSGSTINNFDEYTMAAQPMYSEYFGFTDAEVDMLYERYRKAERNPQVTREDLRLWYDGYHTAGGAKLYNPRSVVKALTNNCLASYWTMTGSYGEIASYIKNDRADIKKDVALMVSGEAVPASVEEYAATAMQLTTRNELLSAMVVYGFLNYEGGKVHIPNKELMDEFAKTIREKEDLGYIHRLAVESDRMLQATLQGDTGTMERILEFAHDSETPLLDYNDETELTAIVNLVYLAARDSYFAEREDKAGKGFVDFIFYPVRAGDDGIILELKVNATPDEAIRQIKDRRYALKFQGKMASKPFSGRILLVGIGYDKKKKNHRCKIEVLKS